VAAYDSLGFEEGTWLSFYGGEAGDVPSSYPNVPGEWYGIPEDPFTAGLGPPPEVMGCLEGT
jgi:hypothetical protein